MSEVHRPQLFDNFIREVKLLHQIHHGNVVRVFNYYLYPDNYTGYILMEFIDGYDIDEYIKRAPDEINELFLQAIDGFAYLETCGILHRDIRPGNLMVRDDGRLKIIDLGFGKQVRSPDDFDKSITLNWWCETPIEFAESMYNFTTEVYFVGKLFERMLHENNISDFKYVDTLRRMCDRDPATRMEGFALVSQEVRQNQFFEIDFAEAELLSYRAFSEVLIKQFSKIERSAKYVTDVSRVESQLNDAYKTFMLEKTVPTASLVLNCFVDGTYYFRRPGLRVDVVKGFLHLLKSCGEEKRRIILANLHAKLDGVERYFDHAPPESDDIPF